EAEAGFRKALAIRCKGPGEQHSDTVHFYTSLANFQHSQEKYTEAEKLAVKAAHIFDRTRLQVAATGLERSVITSERCPLPLLAALLARNGKPEDAWQRLEESLGRGTGDDLAARLKRPAAERQRQTQILARLRHLEEQLQKLTARKEQRDRLLAEQL